MLAGFAGYRLGSMKVDRKQFEMVVSNMLKTPPVPRSEAKTGAPKTGKIIPAKPYR